MSKYRSSLPQTGREFFLTDGGIETTLIFHDGQDLPMFAAFKLFETAEGVAVLRKYFKTYSDLAARLDTGLVLETATWRANPDWAAKLGYDAKALAEANRKAVGIVEDLRKERGTSARPLVISGCVGPRGDGYVPGETMSAKEAEDYHAGQVRTFAGTAADLVTAITMNYTDEAAGVARAAKAAGLPAVISFTVETDGKLPTGQPLGEAIRQVDDAAPGAVAYFMINCAHPTHFESAVSGEEPWAARIRGLRANASRMSHAELDQATELDIGDPEEMGRQYADLKRTKLTQLTVAGGCCGTDDRHVEQIATACLPLYR